MTLIRYLLSNPEWKRRLRITLLLSIILIPVAIIILVPYAWMFTTSLKPMGMTSIPPYLVPTHFEFVNYSIAWKAAPFLRYYTNTSIVAIAVVASRIVFAGMAAYAFSFLR